MIKFVFHNCSYQEGFWHYDNSDARDDIHNIRVLSRSVRQLVGDQLLVIHSSSLPKDSFVYLIMGQLSSGLDLDLTIIEEPVLECLRSGQAYLMHIDPQESNCIDTEFENKHYHLLEQFCDQQQIPRSQLILVNNCYNIDQLCGQEIKTMFFPFLKGYFFNRENFIHHERPRSQSSLETWSAEYRFLSANFIWKSHRMLMLMEFASRNLLDSSLYSFPSGPPTRPNPNPDQVFDEYLNTARLEIDPNRHYDSKLVDSLRQRLPLEIDRFGLDFTRHDHASPQLIDSFRRSLVSVITESMFTEQTIHITEKTYRALSNFSPFVVVSVRHHLRSLRSMGFKTFHDFWDESYDECRDPAERFQRILSVIDYIASWDSAKIKDFKQQVWPILCHNEEQMWTQDIMRVDRPSPDAIRAINQLKEWGL